VTSGFDDTVSRRIRQWGVKGGVTLLDQAVFSGSNFVLNVLLARWLDPSAYGAFVVAFAIYLFFTGFHNALILEPMSILGPANHRHEMPAYITQQIYLHFVISGGLGLLLVLAGLVVSEIGRQPADARLTSAMMGAGIALPFMLFIWLVRRIYYVLGNPIGALLCSLTYSALLGLGIYATRHAATAVPLGYWYLVLGVASFMGALLPLTIARIPLRRATAGGRESRKVLQELWAFGRWLVIATVLYTIGAQIQVFVTAGLLDLGSAGTWRAVQNFALPVMQSITAIAALGLPVLSAEFGKGNFQELRRKGLFVTAWLSALALLYEIALMFFSAPLEQLIYGPKFASFAWLIPLVGLVPVLASVEAGFSLIVRSLQRPVFYVIYTASTAVAGIIFAPILIARWGLAGAAVSQLLVALVSLAVIVYIYRRWFPGEGPRGATSVDGAL
jgi:O-antigen/teichoic acid export membrane protein